MVSVVRISGINLPLNKKVYVSLSYLFGIGMKNSKVICKNTNVDPEKKMGDLTDEDVDRVRNYIANNYVIEGDLRGKIAQDIKLKIAIGCYEGSRHRNRLPVRGQRTKTNAKTRKGRSAPIANKKVVAK